MKAPLHAHLALAGSILIRPPPSSEGQMTRSRPATVSVNRSCSRCNSLQRFIAITVDPRAPRSACRAHHIIITGDFNSRNKRAALAPVGGEHGSRAGRSGGESHVAIAGLLRSYDVCRWHVSQKKVLGREMTDKTAILHPIGEEGAAATGAPLRRQRQPAVPLPRQGEHLPSPGGVAPHYLGFRGRRRPN